MFSSKRSKHAENKSFQIQDPMEPDRSTGLKTIEFEANKEQNCQIRNGLSKMRNMETTDIHKAPCQTSLITKNNRKRERSKSEVKSECLSLSDVKI
uniref:Uncharacterized protein n=1 Tax=Nelumbo nucifera TaxID=4432 RepID=A0A822ZJ63_NELNU|nr:TPA_asm: hypothetical protein HUJ06_004364 [Nelumbo nucifera]